MEHEAGLSQKQNLKKKCKNRTRLPWLQLYLLEGCGPRDEDGP